MLKHARYVPYAEHMQSAAWQRARAIRCLLAFGHCEMCGDTGREGHHLTYRRMGAWNEFLDVRWLCTECHITKHAKASRK